MFMMIIDDIYIYIYIYIYMFIITISTSEKRETVFWVSIATPTKIEYSKFQAES